MACVCTHVMQTHNNNKEMDRYILNKNLYCFRDFCGGKGLSSSEEDTLSFLL